MMPDRPPGAAGRVTSTRTVWCVRCPASFTAPPHSSRKVAESHWMGVGWCMFAGKWYCPKCAMDWQDERQEERRKDYERSSP